MCHARLIRAILRTTSVAFGLIWVAVPLSGAAEPTAIPDRLREEWRLDPFYQKQNDSEGLLVVGSGKVSDNALAEAAWIVGRMLDGRKDILKAMRENRVRVVVMAATEFTTDLPEHSKLRPKLYWDRRARGLGATLSNPAVSCGEENLLGISGDPYPKESIFVHEFAHAIHGTGLSRTDPTFDKRLRAAYAAAIERGLWKNTYAATNHSEYWAEGVQGWFDDNAPPDALHNDIRTRAKLKEYDVALAELCNEVFGDGTWRYTRPAARLAEHRAHLKGYDSKSLPKFVWKEVPLGDKPRATVQTSLGDFEVEADAKAAPDAVAAFFKIALQGGYHGGRIEAAAGNADRSVLLAGTNAGWKAGDGKRWKADEIPATRAAPAHGTVALRRDTAAIVIFVGDSLEAAPDVVPIGRVVKGDAVLKKLIAAAAGPSDPKQPVEIRRVIRTE